MIPNRTLIASFVKTAKDNGAGIVHAKLPRNHSLVLNNVVVQIRNHRSWAEYRDELGNVVVLCNDGLTRQYTYEEYLKAIMGKGETYSIMMRFSDKQSHHPVGSYAYLEVRGRMEFSKRVATRHLKDVANDSRYTSHYDQFTLERA